MESAKGRLVQLKKPGNILQDITAEEEQQFISLFLHSFLLARLNGVAGYLRLASFNTFTTRPDILSAPGISRESCVFPIKVTNAAASRRFYEEVIGLQKIHQEPSGEAVFHIESDSTYYLRTCVERNNHSIHFGEGILLWVDTPDVETRYQQVVKQQGTIIQPLTDTELGRLFSVHSPDKYQLVFYQVNAEKPVTTG